MQIKVTIVTIAIILLTTSIALPFHQLVPTSSSSNPTPAPSKTLTPTTPAFTPTPNTATNQNLNVQTQADLSILTGNIQRPNGIAWHSNMLYVSCTGDWTLYEINPATETTTQYIYGIRNAHTLHITTEQNELHMWVPDFQSNSFIHIYQGITATIATNLQGPWGITNLNDDTFLITNLSGNNITSVTKSGETNEVVSQLRSPTGITSDDNYIYIANTGSTQRAIEWITKNDILEDASTTPDESIIQPLVTGLQNTTSLTLGPDNLLYFSYALGTRGIVGRVDPEKCRLQGGCTSNEIEIVLYTELAAPLAGLTITPDMTLFIHSIFSPDIYYTELETPTDNQ